MNGLRGDLPRHLSVDYDHMGYVFLSSAIQDATFYGLVTLEMDRLNPPEILKEMINFSNKAVVMAVQTKTIRKEIEDDPEYWDVRKAYEEAGTWDLAKKMMMVGDWYRYYGNIPLKYIFPYKDAPIDKQPEFMQKVYKGIARDKYLEETTGIKTDDYVKTPHPHKPK